MSDETIAETMKRSEAGTPDGPEEFVRNGGVYHEGNGTIMSRETYAASIGYSADGKPLRITARFSQATWWRRMSGEWVRVADMSPQHRYNTAAMLMRAARVHAFRFSMAFAGEVGGHDGGDMAHESLERALDELNEQTVRDPRGWLRETTLYRALTEGLTITGDGTEPWEKTGRDPVTGEPRKVPPTRTKLPKVCPIPGCGCTGEAHP